MAIDDLISGKQQLQYINRHRAHKNACMLIALIIKVPSHSEV